jgi:hypothetical protein
MPEGLMMLRRTRIPNDPFEGRGAKRRKLRLKVEGLIALGIAIGAVGLTTAAWLHTLAPLAGKLGLH